MKRIRVLFSRDDEAHVRGYGVIATALRNEGYEVVLGGVQTPRQAAATALAEDVDIVAYRIMTGAPEVIVPSILEHMRAAGIGDRPLIIGGIVPLNLVPRLKAMGVAEVFQPGSSLTTIASFIKILANKIRKESTQA